MDIFDDLQDFDPLALGLAAVFSFLMYFFMFELSMDDGLVWDSVGVPTRIIILIVGFPLYYIVAIAMINK